MLLSTLRPIVLVWSVAAVVSDAIITVSLVWYLHKSRTGYAVTDGMLTRLIRATIQTGLATTAMVLETTVAYLTSETALYYGFALIISKVYTNSLMSTLNIRTGWASADLTNKQATSSVGLSSTSRASNGSTEVGGRPVPCPEDRLRRFFSNRSHVLRDCTWFPLPALSKKAKLRPRCTVVTTSLIPESPMG